MNYFTKKRLVIWAIILLVVVNITALGKMIFHRYLSNCCETTCYQNKCDMPPHHKMHHKRERGIDGLPMHSMRFIKKELNLTDEQSKNLKELKTKYKARTKILLEEMKENRSEMLVLLAQADSDTIKLYQVAKEIGKLHEVLKVNTIEHFLEIKSLCDEEQAAKLNAFFEKIQNCEGHRPNKRCDFEKNEHPCLHRIN